MNIFLDSSKLSFKSDTVSFFRDEVFIDRFYLPSVNQEIYRQIDLSKFRKRLLTTLENYLKQIFSEKKGPGFES